MYQDLAEEIVQELMELVVTNKVEHDPELHSGIVPKGERCTMVGHCRVIDLTRRLMELASTRDDPNPATRNAALQLASDQKAFDEERKQDTTKARKLAAKK